LIPRRPYIIESKCPAKERWAKRRLAGGRVERQRLEVVVVEVAVGQRHRLAAVVDHRPQRGRVIVGLEQGDLPADQLGVLAGAALGAQVGHLTLHLVHRVRAVGAHTVGLA